MSRFEERGVSVVAISVDQPQESLAMIERIGATFKLGSDPTQSVVRAFGIQNPETRELALHAVYIVDREGKVFYRKVGSRRPTSEELLDAVDGHRGVYPRNDVPVPADRVSVAWPTNNYQALIEISTVGDLPSSIDAAQIEEVLALRRAGRGDDSTMAFRALTRASDASEQELLDAAAWYTAQLYVAENDEARKLGVELSAQLTLVADLERAFAATSPNDSDHDDLLQRRARARAGLSRIRAVIDRNAGEWQLRSAKTTLRSHREVARAAVATAS